MGLNGPGLNSAFSVRNRWCLSYLQSFGAYTWTGKVVVVVMDDGGGGGGGGDACSAKRMRTSPTNPPAHAHTRNPRACRHNHKSAGVFFETTAIQFTIHAQRGNNACGVEDDLGDVRVARRRVFGEDVRRDGKLVLLREAAQARQLRRRGGGVAARRRARIVPDLVRQRFQKSGFLAAKQPRIMRQAPTARSDVDVLLARVAARAPPAE